MAGNQLNNLTLLDLTTGLIRTVETGGTPDVIQLGADFQLVSGASLTVDGNLVVNGDVTAVTSSQVHVEDNFMYLNAGYTTAVARNGGLVVNTLPTATADTVGGAFVVGVAATSNPTVVTAGSATFSAGDVVQISGSADQVNDGIYEVESHVGTTLTIRGVGTTSTTQEWPRNQFVADTSGAGAITQVNVSVLRATSTGDWEVGSGTNTGSISFSTLATSAGSALQNAYVAGEVITTSAGEGSVTIAGTESLLVTAAGGLNLDTVFDFDGTSFDVLMTGTNGFSIDGTAASNVSVDAGDLTLSTSTSGSVLITGQDGITLSSPAGANAAAVLTITGTGTGGDSMSVFVAGVDPSAAAGVAAGVGSIYFRDAGNAGTAGTAYLKTGAADADWRLIALGDGTLQGSYENGNTIVTAAADGDFDVSGTEAISLDAGAASNFTVDGADLTLSTTTSGAVNVTAVGNAAISSSADATISAQNVSMTLNADAANAFNISDGAIDYLQVDTQAASPAVVAAQVLDITASGAGVELTAGAILAQGNILTLDASGEAILADSDTGTTLDGLCIGVALGAVAAAATARVCTVPGSLVPMLFGSAPAGASNGSPVFLSATPGEATLTPPTTTGNVVFIVGILQGADGVSATPNVLYLPQYIAHR